VKNGEAGGKKGGRGEENVKRKRVGGKGLGTADLKKIGPDKKNIPKEIPGRNWKNRKT